MLSCCLLSKGRKVNAKSVFIMLSLLLLILILTGTVEALQTALVRVNDGSVYQIRFRMRDLNQDDYGVDDFVNDFSIYDQSGQEKLCLATDEEVTWELYTAARVLAATPRETPLFDDSALAEALNQAVIDLGLDALEDEVSGLIMGEIGKIIKGTSLEVLNVTSYLPHPATVIIETASYILKFAKYELEYQRLFNAGSRANRYANTARHLQLLANQRAAELWDAINAGEVIDIFGNPFLINEESVIISEDIGLFDPLHLRVVAQVYENYAGYAVSVVTALGKDTDTFTIDDLSEAVINAGAKLVGTDSLIGYLSTAGDGIREKKLLNLLNSRLIDEITRIFSEKINAVYNSAASDLDQYGFCAPDLKLTAPEAVGAIKPIQLTLGGSATNIDIEQNFSSSNNLIYEADSNPSGIVITSISDTIVTITPIAAGVTTVVVTARDAENTDLTAIQTISVLVRQTGTVITPPTNMDPSFNVPEGSNPRSEGLREEVSVITQNLDVPLRVREGPGLNYDIIELIGSGLTGIITDGPRQANGYTWWKVEWDSVNLEGWSAEFVGEQVLFRQPPDLEIRNFDVSDSQVSIGEEIELEVEIRNNGPGESAATDVYFYYHSGSRNDDLEELSEESDLRIPGTGKLRVPSLQERRSTTLTLTVDAPNTPDRYYYGAFLPSNVHPTDYMGDLTLDTVNNNLAREERVEVVGAPDYIVESISVRETTLDPGESFTLRVTVLNQGLGEPTSSADLDYYRSSDALISTSDRWVGDDSVSKLDTDETDNESISLTAPTEPGVYYYGACVSEVANESNRNNNCSAAVAITVRNIQTVDVNKDGVVNIQDLVLVASSFGETGENNTDVNGDGVVNIQDLVLVAAAFGNSASAPAIYSQATDPLDASDVQQWLTQAQHLNLTDATSQRGIFFLERLLAALTPKKNVLLPNYPNPFNPETWIPYQLAESADVTVTIYAVDGAVVRTLALGHQPVGMYQGKSRAAHWDGKNTLGESVASGLYFYTLTAGTYTATRKMLIRK